MDEPLPAGSQTPGRLAMLLFPFPHVKLQGEAITANTEKNKRRILMLLDSVLLQTGNAALPNLINPFSTKPIIRNIQETHSCRIQDVSGAWVS